MLPGRVPDLHNRFTMPPGSTMRMWSPSPTPAQPQPPPKGAARGKGPSGPGKKAPRPKRKLWVRLLKWGLIASLAGALLLVATVAFVFWMYGRDPKLPDYKTLADYRPKQVTTILDANDRRIGEIYTERRTFVAYDKLPPFVVDAFVAAEDNSFWTHEGVDYWGMFRAALANIRSGHKTQGASTITQQVVKTFLLTPEKTFKRKIQEIIIARRLEKALTKQEIMTLYVNQIYFGHGRYGIQEAARYYFGKDVKDLDVGEAAVLAGMPKKPEPLADSLHGKDPNEIKHRQIYVLNQLVTIGKLSREEAQKWIDKPIRVVKAPFPDLGTAPEWVELVREELTRLHGKDALHTLGATVRTTLDPALQQAAQQALQRGLRDVDVRRKTARPVRSIKPEKIETELAALSKRRRGAPDPAEIHEAIVTEVHDADQEVVVDLGGWQGAIVLGTPADARFNAPDASGATKTPSQRFKRGDVVEVLVDKDDLAATATGDEGAAKRDKTPKHAAHRVQFAPGPEGAVVIIENKTRRVLALVGGYALRAGERNRAVKAHRQPGSSFKPYVFAAAIASGRYTPATIVNDAPEVFDLWRPKNYESGKFEGPVRLRHALAKSINTVAIRLTYDLKPPTIAALAHDMGIKSKLPDRETDYAISLGAGEVTPLEMTNAMATLAAGGVAAEPRTIEAIDGKARPNDGGKQVLRPEVAYVVTNMMQSVVTEGTGTRAKALKIPIAGKTGTSNDARDVWFLGMTPDYTIGVWIGYDQPRPLGKETGGSTAVPVFVGVVEAMKLPAKSFTKPDGVVEAVIDLKTGLLAPEGAPKGTTRTETFLEGTAPTEIAPLSDEVTGDTAVTGEYGD